MHHVREVARHQYSRTVLTEARNRTHDLSYNVRGLYQLSYPDRIQFCYVKTWIVLITRVSYGCVYTVSRRRGWYMYVGSYKLGNRKSSLLVTCRCLCSSGGYASIIVCRVECAVYNVLILGTFIRKK